MPENDLDADIVRPGGRLGLRLPPVKVLALSAGALVLAGAVVVALSWLAGQGSDNQTAGPPVGGLSDGTTITNLPPEARRLNPKGVVIDPKLMLTRQFQGNWRSGPGILKDMPGIWIELSVSSARTYSLTLRGGSFGKPVIYAEATGNVSMSGAGMSGVPKTATGPRIDGFKTWSTGTVKQGQLLLTSTAIKNAELSYAGL